MSKEWIGAFIGLFIGMIIASSMGSIAYIKTTEWWFGAGTGMSLMLIPIAYHVLYQMPKCKC